MIALAIAILCFWPPESLLPLDPHRVWYPEGSLLNLTSLLLPLFPFSPSCASPSNSSHVMNSSALAILADSLTSSAVA